MQHDIESSVSHLEAMTTIARLLAANALVVYRCRYDFLAFGSWLVEGGTSHRRLQIVRDGKQSTLRCSTARLQNAGAVPEWEEQEVVSLDVVPGSVDLHNWLTMMINKYGPATNPSA